ncbi:BlaI/MecI/CopY family transcriptional regulator [Streptomyces sp. NPDC057697]|uniref:BlaI/MecI/CopY family transcriptional regulator n=1 Tax=Streptomyces sp. NPDC057697 TaxID=3346219 RepID=UPI003678B469
MSQAKGIPSGEPGPGPHGEPVPDTAPRPRSRPAAAPERRPAGELESTILAALWAAGTPLTPGQVQGALGTELARTTVTTILSRLYEKGTVARTRAGRGFAYTPTEDEPGLTARRMHSELRKQEDRGTALARFVSQLTEEDERLLRDLLDGEAP